MPTRALKLSFAHLNLRRNPFGEPPREERAGLAVVSVDGLADELHQRCASRPPGTARDMSSVGLAIPRPPPLAVQFVGEPGRGKTTHLLALHRYFPDAHLVRWTPDGWPEIPSGDPLFIDDAYLLDDSARRRTWRRGVCVVLAARHDLGLELRKRGFEVRTVLVAEQLTTPGLRRLLDARVEWARRGPRPVPGFTDETLETLRRRFGTDVRTMERHLYDVVQALHRPRDV